VLARRIAYRLATGSATADHVLAVTFTRRAAGQLLRRLGGLGIRAPLAAGTLHATALALLQRCWAEGRGPRPTVLADPVPMLASLLPDGVGDTHLRSVRGAAPLAAELAWMRSTGTNPDNYEAAARTEGRVPPLPPPEMARLAECYTREKRRRGLFDFEDIVEQCAMALETDAELAAGMRWRFRHIFVDEYQDLTPLHERFIAALRGGSPDLFAVGDPDQSIYGWSGSDPSLLWRVVGSHPSAEVVSLDINHRCTAEIARVAHVVLAPSRPAGSRRPPGDLHGDPPWPAASGPLPVLTSYRDGSSEARAVADKISSLSDARRAGVAVLARTHDLLVGMADALVHAGVPFRLAGPRPLCEEPALAPVLTLIASSCEPVSVTLRHAHDEIAGLAVVADAVDEADDVTDDDKPQGQEGQNRMPSCASPSLLRALRAAAAEYEALGGDPSASAFLAWLAETRWTPDSPAGVAVELATFHQAKGLEWQIVFIIGLENGLVPIHHATNALARAEERRLLYVALTRAQEELYCSWARARLVGDRVARRDPSPALARIDAVLAELSAPTPPEAARQRFAALRAQLASCSMRTST